MASIDELKNRIDLHDLAEKLNLERPQANGNYKSPQHDDKSMVQPVTYSWEDE